MSAPNLEQKVEKAVKDLLEVKNNVLPVVIGKEVVSSVRGNFRSGGFYGAKWKAPLRTELGFKGAAGRYGPLLSAERHLMDSTDYIPGNGRVTIRNNTVYASVHNQGADIRVTPRMRRFFWARYYETAGAVKKTKGGKRSQSAANQAISREAEFWKNMALKKVGSKIRIPQRQFLGENSEVERIVRDNINKALSNYIQTHFK